MSFEEAYGHYTYDPYQASNNEYAGGQEPYYPASMHPSYGPQVDPSSSARFNYEDPIFRSISDLSNRINTLGTQQQPITGGQRRALEFCVVAAGPERAWRSSRTRAHRRRRRCNRARSVAPSDLETWEREERFHMTGI